MSKIISCTLPFGLAVFLGLTGCASVDKTSVSETAKFRNSLSAADDPDGDGDNKGANYFPKHRAAVGRKVFVFDPNYHAWAVYDESGDLVNSGKASGGSLYCPDVGRRCTTIVGEFRIISKEGEDCISRKYPLETNGGAHMPHCMFFSAKGYAIHGSNDIPDDYNASHGCIRVTPTAAKWLNENFLENGSKVIVLHYNQ